MDIRKNLERLDALYAQGELKEAEACLHSWLQEAGDEGNTAAMLTLLNEMEGLYRTTGRAGEAALISDKALSLIEQMGLENTIPHGTTLLKRSDGEPGGGEFKKGAFHVSEGGPYF